MRYRPKKGQKGAKKGQNYISRLLAALFIVFRFYFEFKIGEEYHKIQSDTIFIDIYSIWGGLFIKKGTKRVKKSQIWVSRLVEALFIDWMILF